MRGSSASLRGTCGNGTCTSGQGSYVGNARDGRGGGRGGRDITAQKSLGVGRVGSGAVVAGDASLDLQFILNFLIFGTLVVALEEGHTPLALAKIICWGTRIDIAGLDIFTTVKDILCTASSVRDAGHGQEGEKSEKERSVLHGWRNVRFRSVWG